MVRPPGPDFVLALRLRYPDPVSHYDRASTRWRCDLTRLHPTQTKDA